MNTQNRYRKAVVDSEYDKILVKIKDGFLMGEPIDLDDPKQVAYCFYLLAQAEERAECQRSLDVLSSIAKERNAYRG